MNKIKKGDQVAVLCGRQKGGRGVVLRVYPDARGKPEKVLVEGINMVTHYDRPDPRENKPGGLTKREAPIHVSNVALVGEDGRPGRVNIVAGDNGKMRKVSGNSGGAGKEAA